MKKMFQPCLNLKLLQENTAVPEKVCQTVFSFLYGFCSWKNIMHQMMQNSCKSLFQFLSLIFIVTSLA